MGVFHLHYPDLAPVLALCAKAVMVPNNRYREPRWSTLEPPEVPEFRSPTMQRLLADLRREYQILDRAFDQMAARAKADKISHRTAAMAIGVEKVRAAKTTRGLFP